MILLVLLAYLSDAWGYTATKAALIYAQPIICTALRTCISGIVLLWFVWARYPQQIALFKATGWQHRRLFASIIFFYIYLCYITYFIGMCWLPSSTVALLYNLSPFVIAFLGYYLVDQRMTPKKWLGLLIGFCAVLPLVFDDVRAPVLFSSLAEFLVIISLFAGSYGWFVVHRLMELGYSPLLINGIGMFGTAVLALPTSWLLEGSFYERLPSFMQLFHLKPEESLPGIVPLLGYTLLSVIAVDIIYYNLIAYCFRYHSLVFLSLMGMITPLIVAPMGWLLLNESLPLYFIPSFMVLVLGLTIFYQEELNQLMHRKS